MKVPKFVKNKLDKNIFVTITNSQINGNTFDVRTIVNQIPQKKELQPNPQTFDFIDMGPSHNVPHIEAQKKLENQKKDPEK